MVNTVNNGSYEKFFFFFYVMFSYLDVHALHLVFRMLSEGKQRGQHLAFGVERCHLYPVTIPSYPAIHLLSNNKHTTVVFVRGLATFSECLC